MYLDSHLLLLPVVTHSSVCLGVFARVASVVLVHQPLFLQPTEVLAELDPNSKAKQPSGSKPQGQAATKAGQAGKPPKAPAAAGAGKASKVCVCVCWTVFVGLFISVCLYVAPSHVVLCCAVLSVWL